MQRRAGWLAQCGRWSGAPADWTGGQHPTHTRAKNGMIPDPSRPLPIMGSCPYLCFRIASRRSGKLYTEGYSKQETKGTGTSKLVSDSRLCSDSSFLGAADARGSFHVSYEYHQHDDGRQRLTSSISMIAVVVYQNDWPVPDRVVDRIAKLLPNAHGLCAWEHDWREGKPGALQDARLSNRAVSEFTSERNWRASCQNLHSLRGEWPSGNTGEWAISLCSHPACAHDTARRVEAEGPRMHLGWRANRSRLNTVQ
ncbi:hypothetical protein CALCODRAFT_380237 [Calocera cornea HHB12733]|uniref:Uncharacterized protein n=1 Tax=Calocera cornea HHB12733 TaxID=1353952 RepID=A0A165ECK8_9BASI|nr:hypothetical protein CALCODRAFT_380237 [Calocera cornea HHB12733]